MGTRWLRVLVVTTVVGLIGSACGGDDDDKSGETDKTTAKAATTTEADEPTTTEAEETTTTEVEETTTTEAAGAGEEISQWASDASATSEYGNPSWAATQATGAPDTADCGDSSTAWASETAAGVDTLTLTYDQAVVPTVVNVWISYNPNQVTEISVSGPDGEAVIYTGEPEADDSCPLTLGAMATDVAFAVDTVKVTIDQAALALWCEIDAVELVGVVQA